MRNMLTTARGPVLAGLAGMAAVTFAPFDINDALANGGGKTKRTSAPLDGPTGYASNHQSTMMK